MSSDLYVQSIARGTLTVRRRKHVTGEVMICFNDPSVPTIHITNNDPVLITEITGATVYAIQRSNIRQLISMGYLECILR